MWIRHHPRAMDVAGSIPFFVDPRDTRKARVQLNENYAHGGGWAPMRGWELLPDDRIRWKDEVYAPAATLKMTGERVVVYHHAWVAIIQDDGSFEVARMD